MFAFAIIEQLNVIKDIAPGFISGCIDFPFDPFPLQQLEKAFSHSIVMAVSSPAHTAFQAMIFQESLPVLTGVLATLVRMNHDLLFRVTSPYRHQ